jgi:hypothetical protein
MAEQRFDHRIPGQGYGQRQEGRSERLGEPERRVVRGYPPECEDDHADEHPEHPERADEHPGRDEAERAALPYPLPETPPTGWQSRSWPTVPVGTPAAPDSAFVPDGRYTTGPDRETRSSRHTAAPAGRATRTGAEGRFADGRDEVFDYAQYAAADQDDRRVTPFDLAAYGLGMAAFAGVMLVCLAVLAMGGLTTVDVVVGLAASAAACCCGGVALLRLRYERGHARRLAAAGMALGAVALPILWTVLWNALVRL